MAEEQRWYNSNFSNMVGCGVLIFSFAFLLRSCGQPSSGTGYYDVQLERVKQEYVLQEKDLNGDGKTERFYEIEGTKYFSDIDGKNLENFLRE